MKRPKFQPPPPPLPKEPQLQIFDKPEDQILLHGEMIRDASTITEILQGLPFAGNDYRGNLRVIISANLRIRDVCLALLGEKEPKASIKIDEPEPLSTHVDDPDEEEIAEHVASRRESPTARQNGKRGPKKRGQADDPKPAGMRKTEILQLLRKTAMTSGEVIKKLEPGGASAQSIYQTLSEMRNEDQIDTRIDPLDGQKKNFIK